MFLLALPSYCASRGSFCSFSLLLNGQSWDPSRHGSVFFFSPPLSFYLLVVCSSSFHALFIEKPFSPPLQGWAVPHQLHPLLFLLPPFRRIFFRPSNHFGSIPCHVKGLFFFNPSVLSHSPTTIGGSRPHPNRGYQASSAGSFFLFCDPPLDSFYKFRRGDPSSFMDGILPFPIPLASSPSRNGPGTSFPHSGLWQVPFAFFLFPCCVTLLSPRVASRTLPFVLLGLSPTRPILGLPPCFLQ